MLYLGLYVFTVCNITDITKAQGLYILELFVLSSRSEFNCVISLFGFLFRYQIKLLNKSISEVLKLANTLNQNTPIFLHTQPWSYKAINLYNKFGFSILKSKTFSNYVNEYNDAVKILKDLYSDETYYNIMKNAI